MTTAQDKLLHEEAEKAKAYKVPFDPERVFYLASAAHVMRDYQAVTALSAAITRELFGINAKQMELDAKDTEERAKKLSAALASDAEEKENESSPPRTGARARASQT